jgi:tRNA(Arg) A34 adenosine deaminase TadA
MINKFIKEAIRLSIENAKKGGGPFGAVIVKNNKIIARGVNRVTLNNDPTAHAEIQAIRKACQKINSYNLSGCIIFSSCEPCPMCLGAIYWAHIDKIYYVNTRKDAQDIGFDDNFIYSELSLPASKRTIPLIHLEIEEAKIAFQIWEKLDNKMKY